MRRTPRPKKESINQKLGVLANPKGKAVTRLRMGDGFLRQFARALGDASRTKSLNPKEFGNELAGPEPRAVPEYNAHAHPTMILKLHTTKTANVTRVAAINAFSKEANFMRALHFLTQLRAYLIR